METRPETAGDLRPCHLLSEKNLGDDQWPAPEPQAAHCRNAREDGDFELVIHCGLHKTATTSFQEICFANRSVLLQLGVLYPSLDNWRQHSLVIWDAQRLGLESIGAFFSGCISDASTKCHTVLLSGEDFENCIVDIALASEIEALARAAGFDSIEWVVVTRSIDAYVPAIYSEMSKHGALLRLDLLEHAARERGCAYLSTENYNYIFVFDYARFRERFMEGVTGEVTEFGFDKFVETYPGAILLERILGASDFARFRELATIETERANARLDRRTVEVNYVSTALGAPWLGRLRYRLLAAPLVRMRLRIGETAVKDRSRPG